MGVTDELWERFGSLRLDDVPDAVRTVARHSVLDWFGCTIAGAAEPLSRLLRDEFGGVEGRCSIIGSRLRADPYRAAMVNGATAHALDFDDTSPVMGGHPTVPVLPAVLAVAEDLGRSGADVVAAYVVGMEVQSRLGASIGTEHYARGWHTTSTMGVFGATAAVSWLLGLDREAFASAMGIAASNASGVKANFGTMTKPLHPGQAAERGVVAAKLAARGFTASPDAVEGNQGFAQAAGSGALDRERLSRWDEAWATSRTLFKFHAACHLTHAGIEATSSLLDGDTADDIEQISLTVNPSILDVCGIESPGTGLEAKFSLRGTQALLVHGIDTAAINSFGDGPINRADVQAFLDRVTVCTDSSMPAMTTTVELVAGDTRRATVDVSRPTEDLDLQGERLLGKFVSLTAPVLGDDAAALGEQLLIFDEIADPAKTLRNLTGEPT